MSTGSVAGRTHSLKDPFDRSLCLIDHYEREYAWQRHRHGRHNRSVLKDADGSDASGVAEVARAYLRVGENRPSQAAAGITIARVHGRVGDDLRRHGEKLSQLPAGMRTRTGQRLAVQRHSATHACLEALERETRSALGDVS